MTYSIRQDPPDVSQEVSIEIMIRMDFHPRSQRFYTFSTNEWLRITVSMNKDTVPASKKIVSVSSHHAPSVIREKTTYESNHSPANSSHFSFLSCTSCTIFSKSFKRDLSILLFAFFSSASFARLADPNSTLILTPTSASAETSAREMTVDE